MKDRKYNRRSFDVAKAAALLGIKRRAVYMRLHMGWCSVHAISVRRNESPPASCPDCQRVQSDETKLSAVTISARRARGWSPADAVEKPLQRRGAKRGFSKTPAQVLARRAALGINANVVASRVRRGWSRQEAETVPNGSRARSS